MNEVLNSTEKEQMSGVDTVFLISNKYGNTVAVGTTAAIADKMISVLSNKTNNNKDSYDICPIQIDYLKFPGEKGINFSDNVARCPKCGGAVVEMSKAYSCVNWKNGCRFSIWKERFGSMFTMDDAISLLKGENIAKENIDKDGNPYSVTWALDEHYEQRFKRI